MAIYIACFCIGILNHARDFLVGGWRPYAWGPPLLEAFWTSLIVLDALVVILIIAGRRRLGIALAAAIMITDVAANIFAWRTLNISAFSVAVPLQAAFLGFILGSLPFLWSTEPESDVRERVT